MGVLSALPIISIGNSCCCLWVLSGGFVAAYVLQQGQDAPITPADGALCGFLAGIAGAFVYLIIALPIDLIVGPMEREMLRRVVENLNGAEGFRNYASRAEIVSAPIRAAIGFFFMLFVGAIFSTIGGLLGAMVFRKAPPPAAIDGLAAR
jgi:hypothetical protein